MTEICFGDDIKALYPAVGLQTINEETIVFIADLNSSNLWLNQASNTSDPTVPAQSPADQLPIDTGVIHKILLLSKILHLHVLWHCSRQCVV